MWLSKKKIFFSWSLVFLCVLSILTIAPIARSIRNYVEANWNAAVFGYIVLFVVTGSLVFCSYFLWFRLKIRALSNYLWLAAVALVYIFFTLKLWERPEEAIHFLEYGLLGFLLFKAFQHHIPDKSVYVAAFFLGTLIGIFDEILQWMIPLRYWDLRDVGLNALSVALFQVAIWKGLKPKIPSIQVKPRSIKIISWLLASNLLLLGLCSTNTPQRVDSYTKLFPSLSYLKYEEPMREPKLKHRDPEIGIFYSRLSLEDIAKMDEVRAEEYGAIFTEWRTKKFAEFLLNFPGYARPFLYEMRVHIFRRNRRYSLAKKADNKKDREENMFIAYKENLILEKYFGKTLHKSPYKWQNKRSRQIEEEIDTTAFYRSPVGVTAQIPLEEKALWGVILLIIISLVYINKRYSRQKKSA
jgi:VanZ family protein